MQTRWGFNIGGNNLDNAEWELLLQDAIENPPAYTLIMDNEGRARQWAERIPSCQVIYRTYDGADNYYHHRTTPQDAAARLERDHHDFRNVWHYYRLNEPANPWNRYQDWIIRFAQEAKARGFKVTAGGLALGKNWSSPDEIAAGKADALLDYAIANEDTFLFDAHEYVTGTLWAPQLLNYPSALFDRDLLLANEQIPVIVDKYIGHLGVNWGLFRMCWLTNARALERHGRALNVVIDEGLFDFNDHIIREPHTLSTLPTGLTVKTETELRKYAEDRYNKDVRGILAHRLYLTWVFTGKLQHVPDDDYCDMIIRNFQWAERSYPENVKGIMLFAVNNNWRVPRGHDYTPLLRTLLPKMRVLRQGQPIPDPTPDPLPIPVPDPHPEPTPDPIPLVTRWIRSTYAAGTNIRLNPDTNSAIIGLLQADWLQAQVSGKPFPGATYEIRDASGVVIGTSDQWYEVQTAAVRGFVAAAYVEIRDLSPVPDEIRVSFPVDRQDIDALIAILRRQLEQLELAKEGKLASQIAAQVYASGDRFPYTG